MRGRHGRALDLATRKQIGEPLWAHFAFSPNDRRVNSVAVGRLGADQILITCAASEARVSGSADAAPDREPLTGHAGRMRGAAFGMVNGLPAAVTAGADRTARIWDLTAENPAAGDTGDINALATCTLGGRRLAITGGEDTMAQVWDLPHAGNSGALSRATPVRSPPSPSAVARPHRRGDWKLDATVRLWDVETQQLLTAPLIGHTNAITAVLLDEYCRRPRRDYRQQRRDGPDLERRDWARAAQAVHRTSWERGRLATGKVESGVPTLRRSGRLTAAYVWPLDASDPDRAMTGMLDSDDARLVFVEEVGVVDGRPVLLSVGGRQRGAVLGRAARPRDGAPPVRPHLFRAECHAQHARRPCHGDDEVVRHDPPVLGSERRRAGGAPIPLHSYEAKASPSQRSRHGGLEGGVMRVWERATSQPIDEPLLSGLDYETGQVALSRLGERRVLITSTSNAAGITVRFHDLETGAAVGRPMIARYQSGSAALVSEDELRTVLSASRRHRCLDAREGRLLEPLDGHDELPIAFASLTVADRRRHLGQSRRLSKICGTARPGDFGEPPANHTSWIRALVATEVSGAPLVGQREPRRYLPLVGAPLRKPVGRRAA